MMQIGGVDNLVLKQVKLPEQQDQDDKKILQQTNEVKADDDAKKAQEKKEDERSDEAAKAVYGDVVGRSQDGDTTRVKEDARDALETGMVFQKDEKENNLMEFNRDQLTIMNEKGDITDNQYNHEITRRDELMEKDEKSAFAKTNAEMIEKQKKEAEKKAQDKAKERLDEMTGTGKEATEAGKEKVTETGKENAAEAGREQAAETGKETPEAGKEKKLENGMNMLAASTGRLEIEEEAVEEAAKSGRSEIIDQILNPEDGSMKVVIK